MGKKDRSLTPFLCRPLLFRTRSFFGATGIRTERSKEGKTVQNEKRIQAFLFHFFLFPSPDISGGREHHAQTDWNKCHAQIGFQIFLVHKRFNQNYRRCRHHLFTQPRPIRKSMFRFSSFFLSFRTPKNEK